MAEIIVVPKTNASLAMNLSDVTSLWERQVIAVVVIVKTLVITVLMMFNALTV
jgi:hypothetical protein